MSFSLGVESCPLVESLALSDSPASIPPLLQPEIPNQQLQTYGLTSKDWRRAQQDTPTLKFIMDRLVQGLNAPNKKDVDPLNDTRYFKDWDKLCLSSGVLNLKSTLNGQGFLQLVLSPGYEDIVFQALNDDLGYQGRDRTISLIKRRSFSGLVWTRT